MLGKQQPLVPVVSPASKRFSSLQQQILLEQLLARSRAASPCGTSEAARREGQIGFEQPLEFEERLVVEDDVIDGAELDLGLVQAILQWRARESRIVLLAGEALFLRRGDDPAVARRAPRRCRGRRPRCRDTHNVSA